MSRLLEEECENGNILAKQATDFLHYLQTQRRVSAHTVAAYSRDLQRLLQASLQNKITALEKLDSAMLRTCLASDSRRGLTPASLARRISAWRMFFDYLIQRNTIKINPAKDMRAPKKAPRLPRALTPDEMSHFLDGHNSKKAKADKSATAQWQDSRDAAMFELLYASGMRVGELIQLDISDIDLSAETARIVRGKGGRGRLAPFGTAAKKALHNWITMRDSLPTITSTENSKTYALFINHRGGRLSTRTVQLRIVKQAQQRGMQERVSPHVLRHSCASHFLQSSQDLRATQELLGHADIASTQIYTRLDFQNLAKSYDRAHPRANIRTHRKTESN